eukprot:TRINITY_DN88000_c0_g1_i1.p1 TRINITY_DN88000_c0_g1~~TRINITY_DN88000_c0_g1_i1.p1  ORF type:complete len:742 (+),score=130.60 TRINITY_DN88000_c0_g1_i1:40-2265(+)
MAEAVLSGVDEESRNKVLQLFGKFFNDDATLVSKKDLHRVFSYIGMTEADSIALLAPAGTATSVCYRDLIGFLFGDATSHWVAKAGVARLSVQKDVGAESSILAYFRRAFGVLQGDDRGGITRQQLSAALKSFSAALPEFWQDITGVVGDVFRRVHSVDGRITWEEFELWFNGQNMDSDFSEQEAQELFSFFDKDKSGKIDSQELMNGLLLLGSLGGKQDGAIPITAAEVGQTIRDLEDPGDPDGGVALREFVELLQAAQSLTPVQAGSSPHLVLNFDVNNTVVMIDSATGADAKGLLSMVFSNSAWGKIKFDESGLAVRWVLQHAELTPVRPEPGLQTYSEFVVLSHPFSASKFVDQAAGRAADEAVKQSRREALWAFTEAGMPGESLRPKLLELEQQLLLPEDVRGTDKAIAAGLVGDYVQLLPAFLHLLRELKRSGRSFTLIFRTFGRDLPHLQQELQALCENRHPLFDENDRVVLDGSDGQPDYRMCLNSREGCGTFYRDPQNNDFMALVMGTLDQPKTIEGGLAFWDNHQVEIFQGNEDIFRRYSKLAVQPRTIALRDFYHGWAAVGSKSHGGKPFFLGRIDQGMHSIFFDDHISASNPKIVDPINSHCWPRRFSCAQLYGVHLVQAQPLYSIATRNYFLDCIRDCETAHARKVRRWTKLKRLLGDFASIRRVLEGFVKSTSAGGDCNADGAPLLGRILSDPTPGGARYRPWNSSKVVANAQAVGTFLDDEPVSPH